MSNRHFFISVLFFPAPDLPDTWIAQGLEHDIAAQGATIEQAKYAFEATIWGYLKYGRGKHPLKQLRPAPDIFWQIWEQMVEAPTMQAERLPSVPAYMMTAVTHDPISA